MTAKQKPRKASENGKDKPTRIGPDLKGLHITLMRAVSAQALITGANDAKQGKDSISQHLLSAARTFPNLKLFQTECSNQERWLKSDVGVAEIQKSFPELNYNGRKIPACWVQAKSNIVKAWTNEADISDAVNGFTLKACNTESGMRKALNMWRKSKDMRESMQALERLGNVVRSLEKAKADGVKGATKAVDNVTLEVQVTLETYQAILVKILPAKPAKPAEKKAA